MLDDGHQCTIMEREKSEGEREILEIETERDTTK
jgi:hypothetical protein